MYLFFIIIIIALGLLFLIGLIIFIRSLIIKKNMGCGLLGLFVMITIALTIFFHSEIISKITSHQSKKEFIHDFETMTNLSYPVSGKIIEKEYRSYLNFLGDYENVAIIEMDSIDYKKILQDVQSDKNFLKMDSISLRERTTPSFLLKKQIPAIDFDNAYMMKKKYRRILWFHKNKQIIVYEDINY